MNCHALPRAKSVLPGGLVALTIVMLSALRPAGAQTVPSSPETVAMLQPWSGPYGGVPPWHVVRPDEFVVAFEQAIGSALAEVDAIATAADSPTFQNTLVALETAGRSLERLQALFGVYTSNLNVGPVPDIERIVAPRLGEYDHRATLHERLFARVTAVY